MFQLPIISRECGECTACCKTHPVEGVSQVGVLCRFCIEGVGCTVYDSRPWACKHYYCAWRLGEGGDEDRPDRSGIVMDNMSVEFEGVTHLVHNFWEVEQTEDIRKRIMNYLSHFTDLGDVATYRMLDGKVLYMLPAGMFTREQGQRFFEKAERV